MLLWPTMFPTNLPFGDHHWGEHKQFWDFLGQDNVDIQPGLDNRVQEQA